MRRDTTLTSAPAAFPELVASFLAEFFRLNPVPPPPRECTTTTPYGRT